MDTVDVVLSVNVRRAGKECSATLLYAPAVILPEAHVQDLMNAHVK